MPGPTTTSQPCTATRPAMASRSSTFRPATLPRLKAMKRSSTGCFGTPARGGVGVKNQASAFAERFGSDWHLSRLDDWVFKPDYAQERIQKQFDNKSLKGFQLDARPLALLTAGAVLHYLDHAKHDRPSTSERFAPCAKMAPCGWTGSPSATSNSSSPTTATALRWPRPSTEPDRPWGRGCSGRWLDHALDGCWWHQPTPGRSGVPQWRRRFAHGVPSTFQIHGRPRTTRFKASTGRINPRSWGNSARAWKLCSPLRCCRREAPLLPYLERLTPCDQLLERLRSGIGRGAPGQPRKGPSHRTRRER